MGPYTDDQKRSLLIPVGQSLTAASNPLPKTRQYHQISTLQLHCAHSYLQDS
jgi:hypothetical protein